MTTSSFDGRFSQREFDSRLTKTLESNSNITATLKAEFTDRLGRELSAAKESLGAKSPEYAQFQRSTLEFAARYTADMRNLDAAFDVLKTQAVESVGTEKARTDKLAKIDFEYASWYRPDVNAARGVNLVSLQKIATGSEWEFQIYTPEEKAIIGKKSFNMNNKQSWKETGALMGEEFANSIKDIALLIASIPGSLALLPRYTYLRANRHESLANEGMLSAMTAEFPALALLDMVTDWEKLVLVFKELINKVSAGKQEDVAFAVVNLVGLLAGGAGLAKTGAGLAGRLAGRAATLSRSAGASAAKYASTSQSALGRAGAAVAQKTAAGATALSMGVAGGAFAAETAAGVGARLLNAADLQQLAVSGLAKGAGRLAGGKSVATAAEAGAEGSRMTKQESMTIARNNANLSPEARVNGTEALLGRYLTTDEAVALQKAHTTQAPGSLGQGNFTATELRAKAKILEEGGFSQLERRAIMENGYAGLMPASLEYALIRGKGIFKKVGKKVTDKFGRKITTAEIKIGEKIEAPNTIETAQVTSKWNIVDFENLSAEQKIAAIETDIKNFGSTTNQRKTLIWKLENLEAELTANAKKISDEFINAAKTEELSTMMAWESRIFSQAFDNSNTLTYRVSSVDGKPFVEIKVDGEFVPAIPRETTEIWGKLVTTGNTTAMRGQTADNFNARVGNEFKALVDRQKAVANIEAEKITDIGSTKLPRELNADWTINKRERTNPEDTLAQVQRMLAKERGRITPEIRNDIDDMLKNGADSAAGKRITAGGNTATDADKLIQNAVAEANKVTTIKDATDALMKLKKPSGSQASLADNIGYEAMRGRARNLANDEIAKLGGDPKAVAAAVADPAKRADIAANLEKLKGTDWAKYALIAVAILALMFLLSKCSGSGGTDDNKPGAPITPPALDPSKPIGPQLNKACGEDSGEVLGELTDGRLSDAGARLTVKTRESISIRWMRSQEWQALITLAEAQGGSLKQEFNRLLEIVKDNPNTENVRKLQRYIGLAAQDSKIAQDGILGPITTAKIRAFIDSCATGYEKLQL